jgi:biphenyl 2,3-dioxygenase ferredoxin subunit
MSEAAQMLKLCDAADVPEGGAAKIEIDDLVLAVFNVGGEIFVTDDTCTHGPGSLSEGDVCEYVVECNFHNGQFDIRTGEIVAPPCLIPLKTYAVTVKDGSVYIDVVG